MKVSYQNYRQQKQSSKVMRSYIVQAAAKGATEEELDILFVLMRRRFIAKCSNFPLNMGRSA